MLGRQCASVSLTELEGLLKRYDSLDHWQEKPAILVVAWYLRALSNAELAKRVGQLLKEMSPYEDPTLCELRERLGAKPYCGCTCTEAAMPTRGRRQPTHRDNPIRMASHLGKGGG